MFNKLTIELKNDKKLDFSISSLMQGVLMELIDSGYAETLHEQGLNPYTQHVKFQDGSIKWVISTLTEESGKKILMPLLSDKLEQIHIRHKDLEFKINQQEDRIGIIRGTSGKYIFRGMQSVYKYGIRDTDSVQGGWQIQELSGCIKYL